MGAVWDDVRAAWGAVASTNPVTVDPSKRTGFMVHWNGPKVGLTDLSSHAACLTTVKGIQTFHMTDPAHLWADIGYNGIVCPHGKAIEGRGIDIQGAHCPDYNVSAVGIMFLVGEGDIQKQAMLDRGRKLYDDLCAMYGHSLTKLVHSDGTQTDCPGPALTSWVRAGMPVTAPPDPVEQILAAIRGLQEGQSAIVKQLQTLNQIVSTNAGALTTLTARVDALMEGCASKTDIALLKAQLDRAEGDVDGRLDLLVEGVSKAVADTLDRELGGFEVSARFVRQQAGGTS